jgi:hypothetical protein
MTITSHTFYPHSEEEWNEEGVLIATTEIKVDYKVTWGSDAIMGRPGAEIGQPAEHPTVEITNIYEQGEEETGRPLLPWDELQGHDFDAHLAWVENDHTDDMIEMARDDLERRQ